MPVACPNLCTMSASFGKGTIHPLPAIVTHTQVHMQTDEHRHMQKHTDTITHRHRHTHTRSPRKHKQNKISDSLYPLLCLFCVLSCMYVLFWYSHLFSFTALSSYLALAIALVSQKFDLSFILVHIYLLSLSCFSRSCYSSSLYVSMYVCLSLSAVNKYAYISSLSFKMSLFDLTILQSVSLCLSLSLSLSLSLALYLSL